MLITEKASLQKFAPGQRVWQGIPSIEVTKKGRIFCTFYSGSVGERVGNFSFVVMSDDGVNFVDPVVVAYKDDNRCFDPCLWIDPLDRLWFTWTIMPQGGLYGAICENPDAEELVWSEPFLIGHEVMMNKPTVLSTGEWLFPITVWKTKAMTQTTERLSITFPPNYYYSEEESGAFVYKTEDEGKTFQKIGGVDHSNRQFDEHIVLEMQDGSLQMFIRTWDGVGTAVSHDRGYTWEETSDVNYAGPGSRFHVRRLKSGRIMMINHVNFQGRNNLTVLLSEDECKTWKYSLLLDERSEISYPDAKEAEDGYIYITYDRERGSSRKSMDEVYTCAREILYAKITEKDIMAGAVKDKGSRLKCVVSKLGEYQGPTEHLFED